MGDPAGIDAPDDAAAPIAAAVGDQERTVVVERESHRAAQQELCRRPTVSQELGAQPSPQDHLFCGDDTPMCREERPDRRDRRRGHQHAQGGDEHQSGSGANRSPHTIKSNPFAGSLVARAIASA
jgi:hypothetical protein